MKVENQKNHLLHNDIITGWEWPNHVFKKGKKNLTNHQE